MTPRRLIAADLICDLCNRLTSLTLLDLLVFKTADPRWHLVGLTAAEQAPAILLSPMAGAAVDRMGTFRWLILILAVKTLVTAALLTSGTAAVLIPLYFGFITTSLGFNLGRLAIIPGLMPPHRLVAFNALNERIAVIGGVLAYAFMGRIINLTGQYGALQIAAVGFMLALIIVLTGTTSHRVQVSTPHSLNQLESSPGWYASAPADLRPSTQGLKSCFFYMGAVALAGGALNFALPVFFKARLGGQIAHWGIMMALYQAGAFLSASLLPRFATGFGTKRVLSFTFVILTVAMATVGWWPHNVLTMGILMLFLGGGFALVLILLESRIQKLSPPVRRGRIASQVMMLRGICYLGTSLAGATLLEYLTPEGFIRMGAFLMAATAWITLKDGAL